MVSVRGLCFSRGAKTIFQDLELHVCPGQVVGIMGPSGIGKTTLLKIIGGQLIPDAGEVLFNQQSLFDMSRSDLFRARQKMGLLFQSGALFTGMSVYDNVAFPLREHSKLSEELIDLLVQLKLEAVGLRHAADLHPSELSGGMARRVALARAIALDPELIMYDEPFVGQDPVTKATLVELIRTLNQSLGLTSIVVSHDVPEVMEVAHYIYLVSKGRVIAEGSPEMMQANQDPEVRDFLDGRTKIGLSDHSGLSPLEQEIYGA